MKHPFLSTETRFRFGLLWMALLAVGPVQAQAQADGCLFQRPLAWQSLSVQWIGGCHDTYADGPGVLKVLGGVPVQAFYGQLQRGDAQTGVLENAKGLQAGRMINGVLVPFKTKAEQAAAWNSGLEAARKTSAYFRAAGVAGAADDYAKVAERIERQALAGR